MRLIIEGKKEEVAQKLKKNFEYDGNFIDSVFNIDPTGYKYIDYLAKQLERFLLLFGGPKGGLNAYQTSTIYNVFEEIIPWFHSNSNRITPEFSKQARDMFIRDMDNDVENFDLILKSPKDITNYHPYFLQKLKKVVDENKSGREKEREAKSQVEKIYEDGKYLVLKPKSYEASCYYGAGTKWCTASKDTTTHFKEYTRKGDLYYFIDKETGRKMALYKAKDSPKVVYDSSDNEKTSTELLKYFPLEITEELLGGKLFKLLLGYSKGKVDKSEIYSVEELIRTITPEDPLGTSKVIIDFQDDSDFFKSLEIDEDDEYFLKNVTSYHSSYEFMDSYQVESDFKDGYTIYPDFDEDNVQKLNFISSLILADKPFDLESEEFRSELSKKLLLLFPDEIDYILGDWAAETNHMMNTTAEKQIDQELDDYLEEFNFAFHQKYSSIYTTVGNLIWWYIKLGLEKSDLSTLLRAIFETSKKSLGGWAEDQYQYQDSEYFDKNSFNSYSSTKLNQIIEKLEDGFEREGHDIKEFINMTERIRDKFKLGTWYSLPKDKKIKFKIDGFDLDSRKINLYIIHPNKGHRSTKLSEQNFYYLLYQPELFEFGEI